MYMTNNNITCPSSHWVLILCILSVVIIAAPLVNTPTSVPPEPTSGVGWRATSKLSTTYISLLSTPSLSLYHSRHLCDIAVSNLRSTLPALIIVKLKGHPVQTYRNRRFDYDVVSINY